MRIALRTEDLTGIAPRLEPEPGAFPDGPQHFSFPGSVHHRRIDQLLRDLRGAGVMLVGLQVSAWGGIKRYPHGNGLQDAPPGEAGRSASPLFLQSQGWKKPHTCTALCGRVGRGGPQSFCLPPRRPQASSELPFGEALLAGARAIVLSRRDLVAAGHFLAVMNSFHDAGEVKNAGPAEPHGPEPRSVPSSGEPRSPVANVAASPAGPQLRLFEPSSPPSSEAAEPLSTVHTPRRRTRAEAEPDPEPVLRGAEAATDVAGDGRPACLTVLGAARYLSISRAKVYELLAERVIRSFTIGRSRRIPLAELDRFIAERLRDS